MTLRDYLPDEDQLTTLALASSLALPKALEGERLRRGEWHDLRAALRRRGLRPSALLTGSAESILDWLEGKEGELAQRVLHLRQRVAAVAIALQRLHERGIWAITEGDDAYPSRLRLLGKKAPPVLFGSGDRSLISDCGLTIVGSRKPDHAALAFAREVAAAAARGGIRVVSGGAQGVDAAAAKAALAGGGTVVEVPASSLERLVREPVKRRALQEGRLALVTPYLVPGFSVRVAMGRNIVIYGLAEFALVVATRYREGGTWAGATEALGLGMQVFVREPAAREESEPKGAASTSLGDASSRGAFEAARALIEKGARPFQLSGAPLLQLSDLRRAWGPVPTLRQRTLFGEEEPVPAGGRRRSRRSRTK